MRNQDWNRLVRLSCKFEYKQVGRHKKDGVFNKKCWSLKNAVDMTWRHTIAEVEDDCRPIALRHRF